MQKQPRRVAVVGAGYIAVELAGVMAGLGSDVSLFIRGDVRDVFFLSLTFCILLITTHIAPPPLFPRRPLLPLLPTLLSLLHAVCASQL